MEKEKWEVKKILAFQKQGEQHILDFSWKTVYLPGNECCPATSPF